ncbi:hypothetical protein FACS1894208_12540 [Clostridia bacterium]|nr:hypothetical protein FACS1894208_12540 [Clostridia bacterium]
MNPIQTITLNKLHGHMGFIRNNARLDAQTKAELILDVQEGINRLQRVAPSAALYTPAATSIKATSSFSAEI